MENLKTRTQAQWSSSYNQVLGEAHTDPALADDSPESYALAAAARSFNRVRAVKVQLAAVSAVLVARSTEIAKAKLTAAGDTDLEFR